MNMSFYTAAVGAFQQQLRMDVQSHNIANVNTQGYRCERVAFGELMNRDVEGINGDNLPKGTGARMIHAPIDTTTRGFKDTGMTFDFAINGDGFFALWDPATGDYSYTLDGSFIMSEYQIEGDDGQLESHWYLSDGFGRFVMGRNGRMVEVTDENREKELPVGIYDFVNTNGMENIGENRFVPVEKNGQLRVGAGTLLQGYLENSNVDLANELSKVIESQRSFTYALKMIQASDEIETTVNDLRS